MADPDYSAGGVQGVYSGKAGAAFGACGQGRGPQLIRMSWGAEGVAIQLEVEYELTPDDLFAFQWRAAFDSPLGRRTTRKAYLGWFLALLLFSIVPAIGPDGFVISRIDFKFLLIAFPIVILAQHFLGRWLMRRAILRLLGNEKPGKGHLGRHKVVLTEGGVVENGGR